MVVLLKACYVIVKNCAGSSVTSVSLFEDLPRVIVPVIVPVLPSVLIDAVKSEFIIVVLLSLTVTSSVCSLVVISSVCTLEFLSDMVLLVGKTVIVIGISPSLVLPASKIASGKCVFVVV